MKLSAGNMATELGSGGEPGEVSASGRLGGLPACPRGTAGWTKRCPGAGGRLERRSRGLGSISTEGGNPLASGCSNEDLYAVALLLFAVAVSIKAIFFS